MIKKDINLNGLTQEERDNFSLLVGEISTKFGMESFSKIKEIEAITRHDVKAIKKCNLLAKKS